MFYKTGQWLRDDLRCARCSSIPRFRALMHVLETHFPQWRDLRIHESSPAGPASDKLAKDAPGYIATQYFPDVEPGTTKAGFRCEDLERQTFPDESFDLVVTQDVFEHVLDPRAGFREICRTLKVGGAHVFTVPWYCWKATFVRARRENGVVENLAEPEYHGNPVDPNGSLVVTEWGSDLLATIDGCSGLKTTVVQPNDRTLGIQGAFTQVFISRRAG